MSTRRARTAHGNGNKPVDGDFEEAQLGIPSQYEYPGMRSYYRGNCNQDRRHNDYHPKRIVDFRATAGMGASK